MTHLLPEPCHSTAPEMGGAISRLHTEVREGPGPVNAAKRGKTDADSRASSRLSDLLIRARGGKSIADAQLRVAQWPAPLPSWRSISATCASPGRACDSLPA